ncbi:conserved hypothetical protein [Neospora caninum Liverpool]|uniref:Uncharacterized protein n=1 Tax=Neospora caninum (strain Liverpool) TaxID=572307 RepID=F0VNP0_NEOCL|nr:conserved hypothetical protein [Neospora caninum Liverpool]CBZ55336.1 conserved hypothetical protein [Neospora caninum Liverpool]CEL70068.1 TPA: hypothetical protein BN1204_057590 [Neospora caninum Liverpool]|eukprot:XP_003885364.1 conserved hypothetical protein [Neospora caninum Liverpool]
MLLARRRAQRTSDGHPIQPQPETPQAPQPDPSSAPQPDPAAVSEPASQEHEQPDPGAASDSDSEGDEQSDLDTASDCDSQVGEKSDHAGVSDSDVEEFHQPAVDAATKAVCEDLLLPEGQDTEDLLRVTPLQFPQDPETKAKLLQLARRVRPLQLPRKGGFSLPITANIEEAMSHVTDGLNVDVSYATAFAQPHFEKVIETSPLRRFAEACEKGASTPAERERQAFWSRMLKLYTLRSTARSEQQQFADVVGAKWLEENEAVYSSFYLRMSIATMELQRLYFVRYIAAALDNGWTLLDTDGKPMPAEVTQTYFIHLERHIQVNRARLKLFLWKLANREDELSLEEKQTADRIISDNDLTQTPSGRPLPPFEARMFTLGWAPRRG